MKAPLFSVVVLTALFMVPPLNLPGHPASGIVVDQQGIVYFIHSRYGVGKIDRAGKLTYIHRTTGGHFMCLDADGSFSGSFPNLFKRLTPEGVKPVILHADGGAPLAVCRDGNLYYGSGYPGGADTAPGGETITRMSSDSKRTLFSAGLKTKLAEMNECVTGLADGPDGLLYVACPSAILKLGMDGAFTIVVHPVVVPDCDNCVPATNHSGFFHAPYLRGLAATADGTVYAAVTGCRCVIKVGTNGEVATVLKAEPPWSPTGVAVQGEDLYALEYTNANESPDAGWRPRVRRLARDGKIATLITIAADPK
jgi:hypothetical protein